VYEQDKTVVYVSAPGGAPEKLCEGRLRATDWSREEKTLLMFDGNQVNVLIANATQARGTRDSGREPHVHAGK
jgi:hypothetical protein